MRTKCRCRVLAGLALGLFLCAVADAQPRQRRHEGPPPPMTASAPARFQLGPWFRPTKEDHGPLQPGELEELRTFVRESVPGLERALDQLERSDGRGERKQARRLLAHLRHLRRLYQENPEMAVLVGRYAENLFEIEQLRRAWQDAGAQQRTVIELELRGRVAGNVRVELQALRLGAEQLQARRDEEVSARLAALTSPEADLSAEPPPIRTRVHDWQQAPDEQARQSAQSQLKQSLERQFDHRVEAMRERAAELEGKVEAEVDSRVQRLLEEGPPPPPPDEP